MALIEGTGALDLFLPVVASAGTRYKLYPTSLAANTELVADTYLMQANCDCNSYKITFNTAAGNIIVKRSGDYYHTEQGAVDTTNSDSTHKVYWTVKNDDTIGTILPGSTGSPAVLGGSWGNGVSIPTNKTLTMKYWELRWIDNKTFLNFSTNAGTGIYTLENFILKNCVISSIALLLGGGITGSIGSMKYWNCDNTNTFTGTGMLARVLWNTTVDYIYIQTAATIGLYYGEGPLAIGLSYVSTTSFSYINISNISTAVCSGSELTFYLNTGVTTYTLSNCKCSVMSVSGNTGTVARFVFKNHVFYRTGTSGSYNINAFCWYKVAASFPNAVRFYNCIFKGYGGSGYGGLNCGVLGKLNGGTLIVEACRNCIFDSNAKMLQGNSAIDGLFGIKNNGYYNNTSEANWTRGPYDTSISNPSWAAFPNGVLHDDWLVYGPGNGWYTTQDIPTGADTDSFVGINTSTQSHTGTAETATTQRLGLAPVFSAFA
jgi:hypothetical protein